MLFASVVFYVSIVGIAALFAVKYWEGRRHIGFVSSLRDKADEKAAQIKALIADGRAEAAKIPPKIIQLARFAIRAAALQTARLARLLEGEAHRLADMVSHKHHFERRETKSEFLKQVSEHPMRSNNGSGPVGNGENDGERL